MKHTFSSYPVSRETSAARSPLLSWDIFLHHECQANLIDQDKATQASNSLKFKQPFHLGAHGQVPLRVDTPRSIQASESKARLAFV